MFMDLVKVKLRNIKESDIEKMNGTDMFTLMKELIQFCVLYRTEHLPYDAFSKKALFLASKCYAIYYGMENDKAYNSVISCVKDLVEMYNMTDEDSMNYMNNKYPNVNKNY